MHMNKNLKIAQDHSSSLTWSFVRVLVLGKKANNANWNEAIRQLIKLGTCKFSSRNIRMVYLYKFKLIECTWTKVL